MFLLAGEIFFVICLKLKIGLHHLVTILNECVNASVGGVMFQLVRILISTPGKIVSKIISYV